MNERRKQITIKAEQKRQRDARELEEQTVSERTEPIRPIDPLNAEPRDNVQSTSAKRSPKKDLIETETPKKIVI